MGRPESVPQWLGNNSKQGKCGCILQELQQHTHMWHTLHLVSYVPSSLHVHVVGELW